MPKKISKSPAKKRKTSKKENVSSKVSMAENCVVSIDTGLSFKIYFDNLIQNAKSSYFCRDRQIEELYSSLMHNWPMLLLTGPKATAKTSLVKFFINDCNAIHVWVDCVQVNSARNFFELVISQVVNYRLLHEDNLDDDVLEKWKSPSCMTTNNFIETLKEILSKDMPKTQNVTRNSVKLLFAKKFYLVFDEADLMLNIDSSLLPTICHLSRLLESVCNITCIFITTLSSEVLQKDTTFLIPPVVINFPTYNQKELKQLLILDKPSEFSLEFYEK